MCRSMRAGLGLRSISACSPRHCPAPQGHTANILAACFLPASRGDQLICCSADRQIRHLNVTKGAVRPYLVHSGRVRAVVPLDARGCCRRLPVCLPACLYCCAAYRCCLQFCCCSHSCPCSLFTFLRIILVCNQLCSHLFPVALPSDCLPACPSGCLPARSPACPAPLACRPVPLCQRGRHCARV